MTPNPTLNLANWRDWYFSRAYAQLSVEQNIELIETILDLSNPIRIQHRLPQYVFTRDLDKATFALRSAQTQNAIQETANIHMLIQFLGVDLAWIFGV